MIPSIFFHHQIAVGNLTGGTTTTSGDGMELLLQTQTNMSQEQRPSYFPSYWLINKDPYHGLLYFFIPPKPGI